jgi:multiple sugar transport system permease protein
VTTGEIVLGLGLALLLGRKLRGGGVASVLILVPWAMPPVIRAVMWRGMYDPEAGLVNHLLLGLGLLDAPVDWLNSFTYTVPAILVVGIWGELPKATVFLLAALVSVPEELYEAARLDGAGAWREFTAITLPVIRPVLAVVTALAFTWNLNTFGLVWVLTQGGPAGLTRLPLLAAYEEAFRYGNVGYAAAIGNAMVVLIGLVLFFYLRQQLRERVAG